ncbi:tRNA epoxyqueuosine(34) reductase QueG [Silvibacterium acidisoli]|uniref:tRNA epoxyqueuosine(34) reductase QueG n=1 Tax=Acidobacteriaceae bacterium ZG23-2 TaxID=2883246 RepID=UPI00406D4F8D
MPFTSSIVDALAREAGFARGGVAALPPPGDPESAEERNRFEHWIATGAAGEMEYLKRRNEQGELLRTSVRTVFPWVRSVIVCLANYNAAQPRSIDPAPPSTGWIARYAWSGLRDDRDAMRPSDYHKVLLKRLNHLDSALHEQMGAFESRCFVDTGPLVERVYARYAGLGWTGKNTCILNQQLGSWLFLGVILTALEPEELTLPAADRCGSCTRCIDACPTQALTPYQMDASRCIAYLTIEKRGEIPEAFREKIGRQVFGCDICQDVCPWNRRAPISNDPALATREELVNPALDWLASMSEEDYAKWFYGSPVKRAKWEGFQRNLAVAIGNSKDPSLRERLENWAESEDQVLAETSRWALNQFIPKP